MKKILIISALLLSLNNSVRAQVTVTAITPGPRFTLDDLWNMTIVRTNPNLADAWVNVSVTVYDEQVSKIVTSTTKRFQFTGTVININKANLRPYQPITVDYSQRSFKNELAKQGGIFPSGNYKVEISCNSVGNGEYTEPLGKFVYNINAELMMPIQLISVYNNDTIEDENPMFNWIPPYPLPKGNVKYEIKVTEIEENETPVTAIQRNQPQVRADIINQNSFFYSTGSPQLIRGKEYAWQVIAYDQNGNFYSGSETWKFIYDYELDTMIYEPDQYYVMQKVLNHDLAFIDSNILAINFEENYNVIDSISLITLLDVHFNIVADDSLITLYYKQGSNYCYLNFCPETSEIELEYGEVYVIEINLQSGSKYYLRFKNYSSPTDCF